MTISLLTGKPFAVASLGAAIAAVDALLTVQAGHGQYMPAVGASGLYHFYAAIIDENETTLHLFERSEIIKVTKRTVDSFDLIARAQSGTLARQFPITNGNPISKVRIVCGPSIDNLLGLLSEGVPDLVVSNYRTTIQATAPVLTYLSDEIQVLNPAGAIAVTLPTTGVKAGRRFTFINNQATAANLITVASSDTTIFGVVPSNGVLKVEALQDAPTTPAHWKVTGLMGGAYSQATAPTLYADSPEVLVLAPAGAITVTLPTTNVKQGKRFTIINNQATAANTIAVNASGGTSSGIIPANGMLSFIALQNSPTTSGHWSIETAGSPDQIIYQNYTGWVKNGILTNSQVDVFTLRGGSLLREGARLDFEILVSKGALFGANDTMSLKINATNVVIYTYSTALATKRIQIAFLVRASPTTAHVNADETQVATELTGLNYSTDIPIEINVTQDNASDTITVLGWRCRLSR